jgi:hypothetical protein
MWRTWNGHISRIQQILATSTSLGLKIQPRIAWGVHGQHFTIERGTGMNRQNPWKSAGGRKNMTAFGAMNLYAP